MTTMTNDTTNIKLKVVVDECKLNVHFYTHPVYRPQIQQTENK